MNPQRLEPGNLNPRCYILQWEVLQPFCPASRKANKGVWETHLRSQLVCNVNRQIWNSEWFGSTVLLKNWHKGAWEQFSVGSVLTTIGGVRIHQGHLCHILVRESQGQLTSKHHFSSSCETGSFAHCIHLWAVTPYLVWLCTPWKAKVLVWTQQP